MQYQYQCHYQPLEVQSIGHLSYKLYSLGWRSGLHGQIPQLQHVLLSAFLYYRRGYTESKKWIEEYRP